jgi:hypothetical protein
MPSGQPGSNFGPTSERHSTADRQKAPLTGNAGACVIIMSARTTAAQQTRLGFFLAIRAWKRDELSENSM